MDCIDMAKCSFHLQTGTIQISPNIFLTSKLLGMIGEKVILYLIVDLINSEIFWSLFHEFLQSLNLHVISTYFSCSIIAWYRCELAFSWFFHVTTHLPGFPWLARSRATGPCWGVHPSGGPNQLHGQRRPAGGVGSNVERSRRLHGAGIFAIYLPWFTYQTGPFLMELM